MTINVPLALQDQTIESVGAVAWAKNPWSTWMETAKIVFGGATVHVSKVVHAGIGPCFDTLYGLGYETPEELLSNHSYLPLFRPFLTSSAYALSQQSMVNGNVSRLVNLSKFRAIAPTLRFCPECIASEFTRHGYSYAHRTHQIVGVEVCHQHGARLIELSAEASDDFSRHGLLMPDTNVSPKMWQTTEAARVEPTQFSIRYAQFVAAALNGTLRAVQVQHRQEAYRQRICLERAEANAFPTSLFRLVRSKISDEALSNMDLGLASTASANWPAIFLDGPGYASHPVANLLVMALLFQSVEDFNTATMNSEEDNAKENFQVDSIGLGIPRIGMTMALIKSLLRPGSLSEIAAKNGIDLDTVKKLLAAYPTLAKRRPLALRRFHRSVCRKTLKSFVADKPEVRRSDAGVAIRAEYEWLMRHDRAWLDNTLPASRKRFANIHDYDISVDMALASKAHHMLFEFIAKNGENARRSWSGLISQLQSSEQTLLRSGCVPIAFAAIKSLEESRIQHRDRCLARISEFIANKRDTPQAKLFATELLMAYPRDKVVVGMVLSRFILETEQPKGRVTA